MTAILCFLAIKQSNALLDSRKYGAFCYVLEMIYMQKDCQSSAKKTQLKVRSIVILLGMEKDVKKKKEAAMTHSCSKRIQSIYCYLNTTNDTSDD